jgi:signal transduction histidine kinase
MDLPALQTTVAAHFRKIAGSATVLFCGYDSGGGVYALTAASGSPFDSFSEIAFKADGNLIQWLEVNETYLTIPDRAGVFQHLTPAEQHRLQGLCVRLVLPLLVAGRAIGLLLFIDQSGGWHIPEDELPVWLTCADRVALMCEAAERRRVDYERLRTRHQAQQLVVAGQLAASIAHEVRNPLSTIRSTIQYVISSQSAWSGKRELLNDALTEIDRIEHSVSGMLSLSRPRELARADLDLATVACAAVRLVQAYADAQRVAITTDVMSPIAVIGDEKELRQVFVNLLLNACQAMPSGGAIRLSSGIEASDDDDDHRRFGLIRIADSGPGIPEAQREKVFDPFFTTKATGTGLGLPICLEIATRHDGRLTLTCPAEGGAIATVWLPLKAS